MAIRRVPSFSSRPNFPQGLRVLLLDPTAHRETCVAQLRQCSYEVTCCASVAEALAAISISTTAFDVLLGEASALMARAADSDKLREQLKDVPTIVMSESPKPEEVMHSIKLGVAEVLERPLCPLKLKNLWTHAVRHMMRTPSTPNLRRRGSTTLDGPGPHSSQDVSSTQTHAPGLAAGSPDLTSPMCGSPDATSRVLQATAEGAHQATPIETDDHRRGQKRKSKELHRSYTAPVALTGDSPSRRTSSNASDPATGKPGSSLPQPAACAGMDLPSISAPAPMFGLDATSATPGCASAGWQAPTGTPGALPAGMAWGVPMNPSAVAPGITPPIFPPPATPMVTPPLGCPPLFPQGPMASMMPPLMPPLMPGMPMVPGNPFMAPGLPGQLPPLPMPMLMNACGPAMPGACGLGMCGLPDGTDPLAASGLHPLQGSPCSSTPADPSLVSLSDKSVQDAFFPGFEDTVTGLNKEAPRSKMQRCESHTLLPSLEDLIADNGADDMELELEALSLGCLGVSAPTVTVGHFRRNDSLEDLISQSVVAF